MIVGGWLEWAGYLVVGSCVLVSVVLRERKFSQACLCVVSGGILVWDCPLGFEPCQDFLAGKCGWVGWA